MELHERLNGWIESYECARRIIREKDAGYLIDVGQEAIISIHSQEKHLGTTGISLTPVVHSTPGMINNSVAIHSCGF